MGETNDDAAEEKEKKVGDDDDDAEEQSDNDLREGDGVPRLRGRILGAHEHELPHDVVAVAAVGLARVLRLSPRGLDGALYVSPPKGPEVLLDFGNPRVSSF